MSDNPAADSLMEDIKRLEAMLKKVVDSRKERAAEEFRVLCISPDFKVRILTEEEAKKYE